MITSVSRDWCISLLPPQKASKAYARFATLAILMTACRCLGEKNLTCGLASGCLLVSQQILDTKRLLQERPQAPIFRCSSAPQQAFLMPHMTCTPTLRCRCPAANATIVPMLLSCWCHAMSLSHPCCVSATSGPVEPWSCHAMQLRFSGSFSVFPAVSAAFQAFLSLSLLMHACVHMTPCRLRTWTIASPLSCINRGLPALPMPHLSLLGSWAQVSCPLY
jgi:hypothetical protein